MRVAGGGGQIHGLSPPHRELGVHVPCVPPPVPTPMAVTTAWWKTRLTSVREVADELVVTVECMCDGDQSSDSSCSSSCTVSGVATPAAAHVSCGSSYRDSDSVVWPAETDTLTDVHRSSSRLVSSLRFVTIINRKTLYSCMLATSGCLNVSTATILCVRFSCSLKSAYRTTKFGAINRHVHKGKTIEFMPELL